MKDIKVLLSWPGAHLREIGIVAGLGVLLLIANLFWRPAVEPYMPAELAVSSSARSESSGMVKEESLDFIFRPLFMSSRRPLERVATDPVPVPVASQQVPSDEQLLQGYQLLGVFSSGERGGVILLNQAKERVRLFSGDALEGWVLDRTELRSAHFRDASGRAASLELAVASSLPMPTSGVLSREEESGGDANNTGSGKGNSSSPPAYDGPVTFESIATRQRQEMEAKSKTGNP